MTATQVTTETRAVPSPSKEEELYWLALHLVPGLGPRTSATLLKRFRTPQAIFRAPVSELDAAGLSGTVARSIASGCTFEDAALQQEKMQASGTVLIPWGDTRYPARLREIFDPPLLLFACGRIELLGGVAIGVVGTRHPTPYGLAAAERLSGELAMAGLTIVSGMARGIDAAAHKAALAIGGKTIAVFGCGVDLLYPAENRKLRDSIVEQGLVVSEYAMGSPAYPQNFPVRNRIVSGMSAGILVVEGAQYSGSTITARLATEQGREVFAVPGNITSKLSWAPNLLIKQGAKLVQEWNDVVAELSTEDRLWLASAKRQQSLDLGELPLAGLRNHEDSGSREVLSPLSRAILGKLEFDKPAHLDHLIEVLERQSPSEIIAGLFELELLGLVRQMPGKSFIKIWTD